MSVHYGLQYQRLIEETTKDVANKRCALWGIDHELEQANKKVTELEERRDKALAEYKASKSILDLRLSRNPAEAVEQYVKDNGRYPI